MFNFLLVCISDAVAYLLELRNGETVLINVALQAVAVYDLSDPMFQPKVFIRSRVNM